MHNLSNPIKIQGGASASLTATLNNGLTMLDFNELKFVYTNKIHEAWIISDLEMHPEVLEREDEEEWCLFTQNSENLSYILIKNLIEVLDLQRVAKNTFKVNPLYSGPRFNFLWLRKDSLLEVSQILGFPLSLNQQKRFMKVVSLR